MRPAGAALFAAAALAATVLAQSQAIRITAGRTEIRSGPSDAMPPLQSVTEGTYLVLFKEDGDWFQVELPPHPRRSDMSRPDMRALGYVSKRFAAKVPPAETAAALEAARRLPAWPPGASMVVGAEVSSKTIWLKAQPTRAVWIPDPAATIAGAASSEALLTALAAGEGFNKPIPGVNDVSWIWATAVAESTPVFSSRQPSFYVSYGDVEGLDAREWAPYVVRLSAAGGSWRVVSALPGPSTAMHHSRPHWEIRRTIVQDEMPGTITGLVEGTVRLSVKAPLKPGEYAIVIRPAFHRRLYAGRDVLGAYGPGVAFGAAWVFGVR
jgi:hypothetical protein